MKKIYLLLALLFASPALAQNAQTFNLQMGFNIIYNNITIPNTSLPPINLIFPSAAKSFQVIEESRAGAVQSITTSLNPSSYGFNSAPITTVSAETCTYNFNGTGLLTAQINSLITLGGSSAPSYMDCPVPATGSVVFQISGGAASGAFDIYINVTPNVVGYCGNIQGGNFVTPCNQAIEAGVSSTGVVSNLGMFSGVPASSYVVGYGSFLVGNANVISTQGTTAGSAGAQAIKTISRYTHLTGSTLATRLGITNTSMWLHAVTINTGAAGTLSIFDLNSASCTGTPSTNTVAVITMTATMAPVTLIFDASLNLGGGICVQSSVAGADFTFSTD